MTSLFRSRWAAVGAAVAVTLGGGGLIGVSAADTSSTLVPIAPVRVLDTRASDMVGDINEGSSITVQVTGSIATVSEGTKTVVPSGASAITGNMTLVSTTSNDYGGFATIYPCGTRPDASNINFTSGQTVANSVAVPLSASGTVCIYVFGTAHVLLDVAGYYTKSEISELADRVTAIEQDTSVSALAERVGSLEADQEPEFEPAVVYEPSGTPHTLHQFNSAFEMTAVNANAFPNTGYVQIDGDFWYVNNSRVIGRYEGSGKTSQAQLYFSPWYFQTQDCSGTHYVDPTASGMTVEDWISGSKTETVINNFAADTFQEISLLVVGFSTWNSFEEGEIFHVRGDLDNVILKEGIQSVWNQQTRQCSPISGASLFGDEYMPVIATKVTPDIQFPLTREQS